MQSCETIQTKLTYIMMSHIMMPKAKPKAAVTFAKQICFAFLVGIIFSLNLSNHSSTRYIMADVPKT